MAAYAMEISDHQEGARAAEVVRHGHNPDLETMQSPCKRLEDPDIPAAAWQILGRAPIRALFIFASLEDRHEIAASSIHRLRGHLRPGAVGNRGFGPAGFRRCCDAAREPAVLGRRLGLLQDLPLVADVVPRRGREPGRRQAARPPM
jgi:hypothetical protein